ncbi:MAG: hypothetical protein N3H30_03015, partial [Candidatus Micrarchaeota archaeon]|nr:hypothetical protein [Candidatus Micrarchaeota archaeon]
MGIPDTANYAVVGMLILACLFGCAVSALMFAVDAIGGEGYDVRALERLGTAEGVTLEGMGGPLLSPDCLLYTS